MKRRAKKKSELVGKRPDKESLKKIMKKQSERFKIRFEE